MMFGQNLNIKIIDLNKYSVFRYVSYNLLYELPCKISAVVVGVMLNFRGVYYCCIFTVCPGSSDLFYI